MDPTTPPSDTTTVITKEPRDGLWAPRRRATTVGLVLLVTMVAFEAMSVGAAMPTLVADLGGESLYSWPFTAFLAASFVGTVVSGRLTDTRGPALSLVLGPALFGTGLLVAGTAPVMEALLAGRVLQGLGGGIQIVGVYAVVAIVYDERERPAVFGVVSAAWLLPAIIGPAVAGLVTEHVGWRWVFFGLTPFVLLGLALLAPMLRALPPHPGRGPGRPWLLLAAVGAAFGVSAITWAAQRPGVATAVLALAGVAALVPSLRRLLPRGTLRAARGLPTVVLARGLLTGSFFAVEAYLPLTLTAEHGLPPALAALPLTIGAVGWCAASWWQGRNPDVGRHLLLRAGFGFVAFGLAGATVAAFDWLPFWLVLPFWAVAGLGMGLGMPAVSVRLLELSPPAERGFNSSAMQIWDQIMAAACIGLGGVLLVLLASADHPGPAVLVIDALMACVALAGVALALRTRTSAEAARGSGRPGRAADVTATA